MSETAFYNSILRELDADVIARLHLEPVNFELRQEIECPGRPIENLFFVEEGMASVTVTFTDDTQVEVGMFGFESVVGVSAMMSTKLSLNRVYTQIPGRGFRCSFADAREEFRRGEHFQTLALNYVQAQLVQAMQSAACNAKHEVEARLARWLLLCADRVHKNNFDLSHEFIGQMLGITRPSVTRACRLLKNEGLIDYTRGRIRLLQVETLEDRACECYRKIKDYLDNFTDFATNFTA